MHKASEALEQVSRFDYGATRKKQETNEHQSPLRDRKEGRLPALTFSFKVLAAFRKYEI